MIPIKDELPSRRFPLVNYLLITLNILVYIWMASQGSQDNLIIYKYALIPNEIMRSGLSLANIFRVFASMFMHGGLLHIGGNMLYLWIFGDNVEDAMGHVPFLVFYLAGGMAATVAQVIADPYSQIPMLGASGAIAAVLGAYLVLFPRGRVLTLITLGFFIRLTMVPAVVVLGLWFVLQLFSGVLSLGAVSAGGVAFFAHIGGFVFGLLLGKLIARNATYYDMTNFRGF